ncbi:MAG: TIGR02099 family protein [Methylococcaceae bacterium]|nr:TIGR02099 family protein [Methylococcaceae bacterium]
MAVSLTLVRLFLLGVEDYKTVLENKIRELTTIPIKIGKLRANMRGLSPEIILKDIRVLAEKGDVEPSIKLKEVRLGIDLMQLLLTRQVLPSSWLTLVGAKLSIVRKKDGSLSIVGLNTGDSEQPLWMLKGGRYEVLKSDITWLDQQRNGTPLQFNDVDLLIKNEFDTQSHEVHLISQLPKQIGSSLRVSMSIQGNIFEANAIDGTVFIEGSNIRLSELLTGELPLGIKIYAGEGSFKTWSKFKNSKLSSLTGSIQAKDIVLQKEGEKQKTFQIGSLKTTFNGASTEVGWQLGVAGFDLQTENNIWPTAEFSLSADKEFSRVAGSIAQLDLQELTALFKFFVPLDQEKQALISKLNLKGMLKQVSIYADTKNTQYAVHGVFEKLFINAYSGIPELTNLSGSIKGTNEKGAIAFNTSNGTLFFPKLFRHPFLVDRMTGMLEWQQMSDKWRISSNGLVFNTKDFDTETRVSLIIPKNGTPVFMDLQTTYGNLQDVSHVPEYYPVSIMDKDLVNWLDNAFISGKIKQGNVLVYGELDKFPYKGGQGVFEVLFDMSDVELQFNPDWPNLSKVATKVLFYKNGVTIDVFNAKANNLIVKHALVEIPSFETSNHLSVHGQVNGRIADGLKYIQQTPLHELVDNILDVITPGGLTQVKLDLKIPLLETVRSKVDGIAYFKDASLKVNSVDLNVTHLTGDLRFTENSLSGDNIKAKSLGYPVDIKVEGGDSNTAINFAGKTDILQLKTQFDFLDNEFIKQQITGSMAYDVTLDLPVANNQSAELSINSNLLNVAIDLPGSLSKSAEQKRPLSVTLILNEKKLLPISLNYDDSLKAAINIDKGQSRIHSAHIVYGNGKAIPRVKKGINIQVEQDFFDVSEWLEIVKQGSNEEHTSEIRVNEMSINTKQLHWNNKNYGVFEMAMQRFDQQWQGNLFCLAAKGKFSIPLTFTGTNEIMLDMAYLNLSQLMSTDIQIDDIGTEDIPLIHVSSDQLLWKGVNLGELEIETERLENGVRFKPINVTSDDHSIALTADWIKNVNAQGIGVVTKISGSLLADDIGEFVSAFGFVNDLKDSRGKVQFSGIWPGAPYQFSLQNIDAEMDIDFEDGRISSIEPGFGRILGLLAMEQWIKRLTFDFGDIYKQGLSFNSITGHFKMDKGKARTEDLVVDGVPARIAISGEADLIAKTLDNMVVVVPKSSGAVPIAGTIVSSIAGTITQVLTSDYTEGYFFGSKYTVTGKWDNIEVTPMHEQDGILKKTWMGLTDFSWMKPLIE